MEKNAGKKIRVGIAGLGNVGVGVVKIISTLRGNLQERSGRQIEITAVSARDRNKNRGIDLAAYKWHDNPLNLADDENVDVVVELIGGAEGVARELAINSLKNKKHLVTANKALIAHHGVELASLAEQNNLSLSFEAAVAGGIPVIKAIREGLAGDKINSVAGILNGTCNYILTEMEKTRRDYPEVLKEAQQLGYAEADPAFDVDGVDTAHKLAILTSLAFGTRVDINSVYVEGIRQISLADIDFAKSLNYRIKLLGIAALSGCRISQTVHPVLVKADSELAAVDGAFNGIEISADPLGHLTLVGRGAGEGPTASAVVADIVDIARGNHVFAFGVPAKRLTKPETLHADELENAFYLRLTVIDKPGVVAKLSGIMRDHDISIESLYQRSRKPGEPVNIVLTTHHTTEGAMLTALDKISGFEDVKEKPVLIRIAAEL
jgi:homoserine dehydrogenase